MSRNKTAKAGASFKVLALIASLSMILAGFAAGLMASPASAAAPSDCPSGYVLTAGTCVLTEETPSVVDSELTTWACPAGYTTTDAPVVSGSECSKSTPVPPTAVYKCPNGYSAPAPIGKGTTCTKDQDQNICEEKSVSPESVGVESTKWKTKPGHGEHDSECESHDGHYYEHDCSVLASFSYDDNEHSCTKEAEFVKWTCEVNDGPAPAVVETSSEHHSRETRHEDCGHEEDVRPTCPPLIQYADSIPTYTYMCPAGFSPNAEPIVEGTTCTKVTEVAPTCPAGQNLVDGDCVTPSGPPADIPAASVTVVEVTPVVEAAVVAAPAPAQVAVPAAATVAAPAPAEVAVPAAATLPGSVPAGDGSQAPGLPMWALAMIAVGVLGAGFAGKSVLAARK